MAAFSKRLEEVKAAKAAAAAEGAAGGGGGGDAGAAAAALPAGLKVGLWREAAGCQVAPHYTHTQRISHTRNTRPRAYPLNTHTSSHHPRPAPQVDDALALTTPGSRDGETKVVREPDGSVWAYGWNAAKGEWDRIGEVVAAPEAGERSGRRARVRRPELQPRVRVQARARARRSAEPSCPPPLASRCRLCPGFALPPFPRGPMRHHLTNPSPTPGTITGGPKSHGGRTWDYVFDVELDSGAKLKLAMDAHENPYIVADRRARPRGSTRRAAPRATAILRTG